MSLTVTNDTVIVTNDVTKIVEVQARGPAGLDPWAEDIQQIAQGSGALVINYALGKHVVLTLNGNLTSVSIINWPVTNKVARLTLEILNSGAFNIASWPSIKWPYAAPPAVTPNGTDVYVITTVNAGARQLGHVVGQDYR